MKSIAPIKSSASGEFWRKLCRPEAIFLSGTCQGLFPYLVWMVGGLNPDYPYDVCYIPAVIYAAGYVAFLGGSLLIREKSQKAHRPGTLDPKLTGRALVLLFGFAAVQFFFAVQAYGGLPLLGYWEGSVDVGEVNARQSETGFGQLGLLTLTTFLISAAMLVLVVQPGAPRPVLRLLFIGYLILAWLITSMAGKRQGFLMCIFILLAGLCVRGVNPIRTVLRLFGVVEPFARSRLMSILAIIFGVLFVLAYVGTMGALRTGAGKFAIGFSGITLYMEVPLINFEYQCGLIGFGPYIFSIPDLLLGLLPYRLIEFLGGGTGREEILYPEPTASAGIYGPLHFYTGLWGCLVFAFVLGMLCKFAYMKARTNDLFLLIYAQCSWALFVAHSFNLFLILLYVPAPLVAFTCFYWVLKLVQGTKRIKPKDRFAGPITEHVRSSRL